MGKPITNIANNESTPEQAKNQKIKHVVEKLSNHSDGLQKSMELLQELHDNGGLEIALSLLKAKEKVAKIALDQMVRPPVTNMINNAMAAAGALSDLEPETTKKLLKSFSNGMVRAETALKNNEKVGLLDLVKTIKDPDINRVFVFGLNLLKGMGEGLKEQ